VGPSHQRNEDPWPEHAWDADKRAPHVSRGADGAGRVQRSWADDGKRVNGLAERKHPKHDFSFSFPFSFSFLFSFF
jgi:hypothetical protein